MTPQDGLADNDFANDPRRPADNGRADEVDEPTGDPADATVDDWIEAEASRPTLPDETADGLDELEEEVRHQAEDLPPETPGRL